jgi:hypothetical protein
MSFRFGRPIRSVERRFELRDPFFSFITLGQRQIMAERQGMAGLPLQDISITTQCHIRLTKMLQGAP